MHGSTASKICPIAEHVYITGRQTAHMAYKRASAYISECRPHLLEGIDSYEDRPSMGVDQILCIAQIQPMQD